MTKIVLNRGIPGSGKTTDSMTFLEYAAGYTVRLSRDDDRMSKFGYEGIGSEAQEQLITEGHIAQARLALRKGWDVLVDATHLNAQAIQPWRKLASAEHAALIFWDHPIKIEDAIRRDAQRERTVGEAVIRRLAKRGGVDPVTGALPPAKPFAPMPPDLTPAAPYSHMLPDAYIVDTDGTVADHVGIRSPYDTSRYDLDAPHEDVIQLVNYLEKDFHIIGVSGRSEEHRPATVKWWLDNVGFIPENFFMRPTGDGRPDDVIKAEIYEKEIRGKFNIMGVLDDRARVLRMWRAKGLTTFAVGDTDNNDF
ncbi:polynucleotide kinase [Microbacterium phage DustyDino]|nr:polynucleotide kinase [Microbacterium phage DustyDino]UVK62495.1 polynucleotide kinase [Microbacterium phage Yuma]